jgi:hypothetical protein
VFDDNKKCPSCFSTYGLVVSLDAAFKLAGEAFKKTRLKMEDVENAVKSVRRKANAHRS